MRAIRLLFRAFLATCLVVALVTAQGHTVQRRQDKTVSTLPSTESQAAKTTAQSSQITNSASATESASSSKSSQTNLPTTSSQNQSTNSLTSTSLSGPKPSATNGTLPIDPNVLPIQPSITPGLAVAGVILLILGGVYTLIGIKNKRLHIFLSTAFLTSLAVAVLLVYVMNPPVRNGVQGAYVVAAVITGLIFGALSIVFTEVTEGLGCLLGGFCLGMWFLVLKPGGLVTSTGGKAILIAAFSLSIFALSFSHYTRPHALIGSISFAGATIVILGIDCFSKAGLKEFWLYIWGLNDNIFPLNTKTYPHSRGIRVEIAAIILVFFIGIISQLKLWRIIKERREQKEEERRQGERDLEVLDEEVGRKVEEDNNRERAQWEAAYGDKDPPSNGKKTDSAISGLEVDSGRESIGGTETVDNRGLAEEDQIEMVEMETSGRPNASQISSKKTRNSRNGPLITVRVGSDVGHSEQRAEGDREPRSPNSGQLTARNSVISRHSTSTPKATSPVIGQGTLQPSAAPPPPIVPLPFTIPAAAGSDNEDDDDSSVATFADSHRETTRNTKISHGGSLLRRLSARNSKATSCDEESLIVPHEDDQASSIAATIDDLTQDGRSPTAGLQIIVSNKGKEGDEFRDFGLKLDGFSSKSSSGLSTLLTRPNSIAAMPTAKESLIDTMAQRPSSMIDMREFSDDSENKLPANGITSYWFARTSLDLKTKQRLERAKGKGTAVKDRMAMGSFRTKGSLSPGLRASKSLKSASPSVISGQESLSASLSTQLPRRVSKVVMSYRTNEWAKHLGTAEKPDLEELKFSDYPEEILEEEGPEEAPRPVNPDELQQTAENAAPPPAPLRRTSQTLLQQSAIGQSRSKHNSRVSFTGWQPGHSPSNSFYQQGPTSRTTSSPSLHRTLSPNISTGNLPQSTTNFPQSPMLDHRGFRSASTPLLNQPHAGPERMDSVNLLDQRESMVRNKFSFGSSPNLPIPPEPIAVLPTSDSTSTYNYRISVLDDDMSLKDRRELIQQQAITQGQQSQPAATAFDSHQPVRPESRVQSADKREAMLASWRESVRQDLTQTQQPKFAVESRRADMLSDRQQSLLNQRQQAMATNYRDSVLDERMRRADMLDLHKEVLRKMQASANKHV
ncbi:MAG: hypothetical protein M1839_001152 [Geoglossum umbratile]|nr:MAG: hypothetical protein M1839_001152 [Geoglossum umbratile]